jgi:uncharacterized membrane protein
MRDRILKGMLVVAAVLVAFEATSGGPALAPAVTWWLIVFECALGLALLGCHTTLALGPRRGVGFIALAAAVGWAAEAISLHTPFSVFGARYEYHMPGPHLWVVPLPIPTFWAIFLYGGYAVTNALCRWLARPAPRRGGAVTPLLWRVLLDATFVVMIDLVLDPLQVHAGRWSWPAGGAHFGVPVSNFVGWFAVAATVTGLFRAYEYLRPRPDPMAGRWLAPLVPSLCYGILCMLLGWWALAAGRPYLTLLAAVLMGPVAAVSVILCIRARTRLSSASHGADTAGTSPLEAAPVATSRAAIHSRAPHRSSSDSGSRQCFSR